MSIMIYHNPRCGTSRKALALLKERGMEPTVVEYLKTPPDRATLLALAKATGEPLRALIRTKEAEYRQYGLDDPALSDAELADRMIAHPILINRPIVVGPRGARLGRPLERILEILP